MPQPSDPSPPSDVCLLLRAYAEQRWLNLEVGPVLHQLQERDSLPEEQLGAALAYLEVLWIEASQRAAETDAAYAQLEASERAACAEAAEAARVLRAAADAKDAGTDAADAGTVAGACACATQALPRSARRYHAAVRALRAALARQVAALIAIPGEVSAYRHVHT